MLIPTRPSIFFLGLLLCSILELEAQTSSPGNEKGELLYQKTFAKAKHLQDWRVEGPGQVR